MKNLNLQTTTQPQKILKEYLERNASDILADKINNGVKVEKDGKTLINKKTLDGFMKYATEEARKQAEKGSRCACVEDSVVFGWAVHYFEEDSIEEKLYNEDGTEYVNSKATPQKKTEKKIKDIKKPEPKPIAKKDNPCDNAKKTISTMENQITFFELLGV
jgi:hypothetical protein